MYYYVHVFQIYLVIWELNFTSVIDILAIPVAVINIPNLEPFSKITFLIQLQRYFSY